MASMRGSEVQEQTLERLEQNRTRMASVRASETLHFFLSIKVYASAKDTQLACSANIGVYPVKTKQ